MKETKIEKLILDLSTRWECTPQEAVDRLNSMNESEINKLINSMTKKFQMGGRAFGPNIPYGNYRIINKETVILPKKSGITQTQIDSVYNAEQEAFQKRASELIPELEQKIVDLRDKMGWDKSQRVKPIPGIKMSVTNSDPQYSNSRNQKFENGGFIDCLRNGGSVFKCKCGCDKIAKAQGGISELRQRGVTPAYRGSYPEFNETDSTWVRTPDGYMKNTFSGNTLEQNLVTYDEGGVPRRSVRRITNYDIPAQADTTYRDARGLWSSRNPSWLAKLTGNVHSTKFMDNVDSNLEGFEPAQLNEREVRKTQKKACGGPLPKKSKFKK